MIAMHVMVYKKQQKFGVKYEPPAYLIPIKKRGFQEV
jgi:hypothetical protein